MCFVLYLGSDKPVPTIPWEQAKPAFCTQDLGDYDRPVSKHLGKPHCKYLGSDQECGCGFRNVKFQDGAWPEEAIIGAFHYTGQKQQANHHALHRFLSEVLEDSEEIELYGCWDGEWNEPSGGEAEIALDQLLDPTFFFRERYKYRVQRSARPTGALPGRKMAE
jgi:hypothetical protein